MTNVAPSYKLGTLLPSGEDVEHRYPDSWSVQKTTGPDRLVIAPAAGHVALLMELMRVLPEPFGVLYVLLVSRCGNTPGRYQSPYPTDRAETSGFLKTYRDYFEQDGRHHIWITSLQTQDTLVYDQHNLIYAYGSLNAVQMSLDVQGLTFASVGIPSPHTHRYHPAFDDTETRLMKHWPWMQFPLQPSDAP